MKYDASVIIVNYNGKKYIDALFDSLKKLESPEVNFEVIFVDNNSQDDSIDYLEKKYIPIFNNLKLVKSKVNTGFAGGNNLGVKNAEGKYVIFLNNDTAVEKDWLKNTISCIKNTEAGIVASKLIFYPRFLKFIIHSKEKVKIKKEVKINGSKVLILSKYCKNIMELGDFIIGDKNSSVYIPIDPFLFEDINLLVNVDSKGMHNIKILNTDIESKTINIIQNAGSGLNKNNDGSDIGFLEEDIGQYEKTIERDIACGAAMCILREDFIKIGGFDDNFFMYYEDTDLCMRLRRKLNKKIIYCPTAVVRHVHTGSSIEWSLFFCYYVFRNKQLFLLKNYPLSVFLYSYARFFASTIRELLSKSRTSEFKLNYLKSFLSVFINIPRYILTK